MSSVFVEDQESLLMLYLFSVVVIFSIVSYIQVEDDAKQVHKNSGTNINTAQKHPSPCPFLAICFIGRIITLFEILAHKKLSAIIT